MSEHIKTERDILLQEKKNWDKKWVSFSWLKEQRQKHTHARFLIILDKELGLSQEEK